GARSLAWVRAENERTDKVLKKDARYAQFDAAALKVLESPQRLPDPDLDGEDIYNFWQDAEHVQGILRRTSVNDYLTPNPHWRTVLDYDALAKQDNQKWVAHGRACLYPGNELCMMELSAGGEDAATLREFNLRTGKFVENGFMLPRSKQDVAWLDRDNLLVARDWGPGSMTKSGYPFVVKLWKRGQPLDAAKEIYRGAETDMVAGPLTIDDPDGHQLNLLIRNPNFFQRELSLLTPKGPQRLAVPMKAEPIAMVKGQFIVMLDEDWTPETSARKIPQGSVVALDAEAVKRDPSQLRPVVVFSPTATEFAQEAQVTRNCLLVTTLDNVQGRVYSYTLGGNGVWSRRKLNVPDNQTVHIASTNWSDDRFFLAVNGFLMPSSLLLGDAAANTLDPAKTLPPQFDASRDVVEQFAAISKDGTKVPYFVVRPKDMKYDGSNPTLLSAYGGFQISTTPSYNPVLGKLWLERGGVFVSASIRGGGEFGPAWHEAGLKTHRQRIYDDFAAVAKDLLARRITSPRHLGIQGGSNGGLLMGVEMTQHPDMWNAVAIMIPLLDMLGYEHIAAGASWVAEYGSASVPEERAFLASISPYNQLKPNVQYPEPLIFTTTKDDRVGPVHARKFAAKMEEYKEPFFYEEIIEGGHGAGADLKERAQTNALVFTYLSRKLMD
ncbi:MAG: S9 family peptidase, partial [Acidobacteriaceae bacterium]|nr:S9 family peptidase [Acidobacteriaceae bacterium]